MQGYQKHTKRALAATPFQNLRQNLRLLLLLVSVTPSIVLASEISLKNDGSTISIVGKIVAGDYDKVLQTLLDGGPGTSTVFVSSPGGDAIEAMKIGKLIREQSLATSVPFSIRGNAVCPSNLASPSDCTCFSACVLIYLAGIERQGDYLGVHRVYLNQDTVRSLSIDDSAKTTRKISKNLDEYIDAVGAPNTLRDRIQAASANEIDMLESKYVNKFLSGFIPEYGDWIIAKCGDSRSLIEEMSLQNQGSTPQQDARLEEISSCEYEELFIVRIEKYRQLREKHPLPP